MATPFIDNIYIHTNTTASLLPAGYSATILDAAGDSATILDGVLRNLDSNRIPPECVGAMAT